MALTLSVGVIVRFHVYYGGDSLEPDMMCQAPLDKGMCISVICIFFCTSVQGWLKQYEKFWLNELELLSFVVGIIMEGYCLPFVRLYLILCVS